MKNGLRDCFLMKQSWEIIDNKGSWTPSRPKQTENKVKILLGSQDPSGLTPLSGFDPLQLREGFWRR